MRIDGLRFRTAIHESKHASYGASWGFGITEVHVALTEGHVAWDLDFPCAATVAACWQRDPEAATARVRRALGAMLAPHDGERFPGPCPDATMVGELGRAWQRLPRLDGRDPAPWPNLLRQAHMDIRQWLWRPGAVGTLEELAARLARAGTLDGAGWQALWKQSWCHPLRQPAAPRPTAAVRVASVTPPVAAKPKHVWWDPYGVNVIDTWVDGRGAKHHADGRVVSLDGQTTYRDEWKSAWIAYPDGRVKYVGPSARRPETAQYPKPPVPVDWCMGGIIPSLGRDLLWPVDFTDLHVARL